MDMETWMRELNQCLKRADKKALNPSLHSEARWKERILPHLKKGREFRFLDQVLVQKKGKVFKNYLPIILDGKRRFLVLVSQLKARTLITLYLN